MGKLDNKIALVTGGTGGIGTAICQRLADDGAQIVTTTTNLEKAAEWQAKQNFDSTIIKCDVGNYDDCKAMKEQIEKELGVVDIVVNNAGITRDGSFRKMDTEKWSQVITTNLNSVFNISHQFVDGMTEKGYGRIVNISSINGQKGQFGQTNYSAAKAGVIALTKSLGKELADKNIAVNCVTPAAAKTRIFDQISQEHIDYMLSKIPRNRFAKVEELASLVSWMVSEENSFTTGAVFDLSGGRATY